MPSKRQLLPYLLSTGILLSEMGCPKCAHPVRVEVYTYPCEYAPCSAERSDDVSIEYSFEGGPFLPCESGGACGDYNGSCSADANGTYRIVARSGGLSAEVTTDVTDYSCTLPGAIVELTLGEPKCAPVADTVEPSGGIVTWDIGDTAGSVSLPDAQSGLLVTSSAVIVPPETDEGIPGDVVTISLAENDERWRLSFELGDLRTFGVGQYHIEVASSLTGVCEPLTTCDTRTDGEGATLIVEEAEGEALPWPDIVSAGFVRRYRLIYQTDDIFGSAGTSSCGDCDATGSISVDLSFVRTEADYGLEDEYDDCAVD